MKDFMKSMKKKDGKKGKMDAKAKMAVIQELRDMANDMMGGDLMEGMKKVTVAAPDKEGLEKGLEKAKELVSDEELMDEENEDEDEEDDKKKKKR